MSRYVVEIELNGDFGSIECAIDEIISAIPCVDLDVVDVTIKNVGVIEHDD